MYVLRKLLWMWVRGCTMSLYVWVYTWICVPASQLWSVLVLLAGFWSLWLLCMASWKLRSLHLSKRGLSKLSPFEYTLFTSQVSWRWCRVGQEMQGNGEMRQIGILHLCSISVGESVFNEPCSHCLHMSFINLKIWNPVKHLAANWVHRQQVSKMLCQFNQVLFHTLILVPHHTKCHYKTLERFSWFQAIL